MDGSRGAYTADRAAALSGVPKSTVHYWDRREILVPSISAERVKLWSYPDLMGLRIIYWLRQRKTSEEGHEIPRSTMSEVRRALSLLGELDMDLWSEDAGPAIRVNGAGDVLVSSEPDPEAAHRQRVLKTEELSVLDVFETTHSRGPNLVTPRSKLRIVPGKLGGSPHLVGTRLESQALGALAVGGLGTPMIYRLYPDFDRQGIEQAISLEQQLERNLHRVAA
jgi:DNA-binding transcriptional MerR regulator/uncharacterized protein (DUF433 family)